jgi:hypothetical protein
MSSDSIISIITTVSGFLTVIIALCTIIFSYFSNKRLIEYNNRFLVEKKHEDERREIYKKLNEFYGPYQQLLETSRQLFENVFIYNKPNEWVTLIELLNGKELQGNDKEVFEQILDISTKLEGLRINSSGLVEDVELQKILAKAGTHFIIVKLAYEKKILGDIDRFKNYYYPQELNSMLERKINLLQQRLNELNN